MEHAYTELSSVFVSPAILEPVYLRAAQLRVRFSLKTTDPFTSPVLSITAARRYEQMTTAWRRHRMGSRATSCTDAGHSQQRCLYAQCCSRFVQPPVERREDGALSSTDGEMQSISSA
jgi:hypothetical protein